jgi:diaminopimelate epimerase
MTKKIPFTKMSGAGNDFIIFDARKQEINLSTSQVSKLSNRKNIGCDQLIIIKNSSEADCFMEIYNSDGSLSGACGNATRCVAAILMNLLSNNLPKINEVKIETAAGILKCWQDGNFISVDMGIPNFNWQKIPLSKERNSQKISLHNFEFSCVNVGNPHAVTFINKPLADKDFFEIGSKVENDSMFPERTNVEFAKILSDDLIEVRVWERGASETLACGTGACAVGILAIKNNLVKSKKITTRFKGGDLIIQWNGENSAVIMTGGYEKTFDGIVEI